MRLLLLAAACFFMTLTSVNAASPSETGVSVSTQDSSLVVRADNPKKYTKATINNEGGEEEWFSELLELNPRSNWSINGGEYTVANPDNVPLVLPKGDVPKGVKLSCPAK